MCCFPRLGSLLVGGWGGSAQLRIPKAGPVVSPGQLRAAARLEFQPEASRPSQGSDPPTPPSLQEREGPALESPRHFRRGGGQALARTPPPPPRHHIFTFGCFFLSLLPLPRDSSPGSCGPTFLPPAQTEPHSLRPGGVGPGQEGEQDPQAFEEETAER